MRMPIGLGGRVISDIKALDLSPITVKRILELGVEMLMCVARR